MHDIRCNCGRVMVYSDSGKDGSGYYCVKCEHKELDKDWCTNEDKIANQLDRRIIK